jgi:putative colanic acid biosynthesis UDP-glucose lipid carrier transferase
LSIDELPQFINVLRGEMSIVGPRPHMRAHDDKFALVARSYLSRQFIKPGITGLAQVTGWRGETTTPEAVIKRVEADLHYAEHWSLGLDTRIVWKTIAQVFRPPSGAY